MWIIALCIAVAAVCAVLYLLNQKHRVKARQRRIERIRARFAGGELAERAIAAESERLLAKIRSKERDAHFIYIKASITVTVSKEWVCDLHLENLGYPELSGEEAVVLRDLIAQEVRKRVYHTLKQQPPYRDHDIRLISDRGWVEYTARNGYGEQQE